MPRHNPARREVLTDAATGLLARDGMHGLTHLAVDRVAGLPAGTTSNYFRTRDELLVATAERIVTRHLEAMARIDRETDLSGSSEPLVELLTVLMQDAVGASRDRYLAIFELQLEARRRPTLAAALAGLADSALLATAHEHDLLGLGTSPEAIATLMTLYSGALLTVVSAPGAPGAPGAPEGAEATADSVAYLRTIARTVVRGVEQTVDDTRP